MIRTSEIRNVETDDGGMLVVDLFQDGVLMEKRPLPGKNMYYAKDVSSNWQNGIIKLEENTEPMKIKPMHQEIIDRCRDADHRFWAGDNISSLIKEGEKEQLINEAADAFETVLDTLVIDRETDPNSHGTARRLAKMYFNELMAGRYEPMPSATAFPNDSEDRYEGMLVVRSELKSVCSHHHQPVAGVAYIGIIAAEKLIGLSKYTRIAQWCARRGTLQEELANDIAREIMKATGAKDVGVYIQATHGCCENRGIMAHSSLTQTTVLKGQFFSDAGTKKEFFDNIKLQQEFAPR
jgi:GTP cyclohydrolase IA